MPKYSLVVEVDRLKNMADSLGWECLKEVYQNDVVVVEFLKIIPRRDEGHSEKE